MHKNHHRFLAILLGFILMIALQNTGFGLEPDLFKKPGRVVTRWSSFENPTAEPAVGGMENRGAKGHAFDRLEAGETKTLLDVEGSGMITRMWFTVNDRSPQMLRSLKLEMFWDGAEKPAVSVPFGDFMGAALGKPVAFECALLSNPEGRSFNCYIPMPFRKSARVTITNESENNLRLLFYDINCLMNVRHDRDTLYFHACWQRENPTQLKKDFELLPHVKGSGKFLGTFIGIIARPENVGWWGEGEVKMYIDGDKKWPTLVGTGTEDYIGTGWGQGEFAHDYQGCLISNNEKGVYTFYRLHIPDPVYFDEEIRVTIQQMGGSGKKAVVEMLESGVEAEALSIAYGDKFVKLLEPDPPIELKEHDSPDGAWANYFRRDDVSAVSFFYLDEPESNLPPLAPVEKRVEGLDGLSD